MRRRDDNKKEAIFQATKELLNEIGLSRISMSQIAKRAGVSAATIYIYFENKDDMLKKLYLDVKGKLASAIAEQLDPDLPLRQTLEHAMRGTLRFLLENREDYLFMEQFSNSPLLLSLNIAEAVPSLELLHQVLERGVREGILKQVDEALLVGYCYLPITHLVKSHLKGRVQITEEMVEMAVQMSWDAISA